MFFSLKKWLNGEIRCIKCNQIFHVPSFGFGTGICPDCYKGEDNFIFLDNDYFLNNIISKLRNKKNMGISVT